MKKTWKILSIILTVIAAGCLITACVLLVRNVLMDRQNEETLEALRVSAEAIESSKDSGSSAAAAENAASSSTDSGESETDSADADKEIGNPSSNMEAADAGEGNTGKVPVVNPYRDSFLANEDMAAWIQVPGTNIDYPVMWTPQDENEYLYKDFNGKKNQNGSLILDTDSCLEPLTTNLIIHGHNMKSGAMFGNLTDYEGESYYKEHNEIILYTEGVQRKYEVIAAFRSQVYRKTDQVFKFYKFFQADTQEEFDDFYNNIKALSLYDTGVTAQFGDHFLTLSTCVYHVEQGRFVVVAKEVENGDVYLPIEE